MIPLVNKDDVLTSKDIGIDDYNDVQIAALLHDIGKFWQRSDRKYHRTAHEKLGASFVRNIGLNIQTEQMVLYHMSSLVSLSGKDKFLADIIQKSDRFSSKERKKIEGTADTMAEPFISVFSNLKLNEKNDTKEHYYPITKLELKKFPFPIMSKKGAMKGGWNLHPSYENIWKEFYGDIKKIQNRHLSFDTIYYLLKKYTSFISSAVWKSYPDISLFDHSKTTAAISSCICQYILEKGVFSINDKIDYFVIISGDISGIQNFIYNISSPQLTQKDMAKRLRGRSFYINLLNENLARIITEKMGLNNANILWCGGGHFLIIAPNTDKANEILDKYKNQINEYLFRKYGGRLFLSLVWRSISGKDLDNFAKLKEDILFDNSREKRQKYLNSLDMVFKEEESIPSDICKICGSISDGDICNECNMHKDLGDKITRAQYIVRIVLKDSIETKFDFQEFNIGYLLPDKKENLLKEIENIYRYASKIQIFTLNSTDFLDEDIIKKLEKKNIQASFGFSFIGNTVPFINNKNSDDFHLLSFEDIAKVGRGSKKLGILKMDIDNLGKLFEIGLGDDVSISRTSTMSSLLDIFVSGYINELANEYYVLSEICSECIKKVDCIDLTNNIKIYREKESEEKVERVCNKCSEKKIPIIYINYTAGDDLLVIGPWDIIVRFAKDLKDKFKKYTCMNSDINISAGIHICGPKFPIGRSIIVCNDMLNRSKTLKYSDKESGKARISIFTETVKWESFDRFKGYDDLLKFADYLEQLIEKNKISHGFVYDLLILLKSTFRELEELEYKTKMKMRLESRTEYVPRLKYKLARVVKDDKDKEDLNKMLMTDRMFPWIEIPASIVSLKWR